MMGRDELADEFEILRDIENEIFGRGMFALNLLKDVRR